MTPKKVRLFDVRNAGEYPVVMGLISLTAIAATFFLANSTFDVETKTYYFAIIVVTYISLYAAAHYYFKLIAGRTHAVTLDESEVDAKLKALDDARHYLSGSLSSADMFRLVSSRINEIVKFDLCVQFEVEPDNAYMRLAQASGEYADQVLNWAGAKESIRVDDRLKGGYVDLTSVQEFADRCLPLELRGKFSSGAAIALERSDRCFSILHFYVVGRNAYDAISFAILEAIGERVSPLLAGSSAFDRNLNNALTDPLTELPNERAFYMVLENQIAQSQRKQDNYPLTILAMDISNFDSFNATYGHAVGDRVLHSLAVVFKNNLRDMDFVARSRNDEFLAVLPTASESIAGEVIKRIQQSLSETSFTVDDISLINPTISVGSATFGTHGDSATELLKIARERKRQSKLDIPSNIVWLSDRTT